MRAAAWTLVEELVLTTELVAVHVSPIVMSRSRSRDRRENMLVATPLTAMVFKGRCNRHRWEWSNRSRRSTVGSPPRQTMMRSTMRVLRKYSLKEELPCESYPTSRKMLQVMNVDEGRLRPPRSGCCAASYSPRQNPPPARSVSTEHQGFIRHLFCVLSRSAVSCSTVSFVGMLDALCLQAFDVLF